MLVAESSPQTELLLVLVLILLPPDIEHSVHMETEWPTVPQPSHTLDFRHDSRGGALQLSPSVDIM